VLTAASPWPQASPRWAPPARTPRSAPRSRHRSSEAIGIPIEPAASGRARLRPSSAPLCQRECPATGRGGGLGRITKGLETADQGLQSPVQHGSRVRPQRAEAQIPAAATQLADASSGLSSFRWFSWNPGSNRTGQIATRRQRQTQHAGGRPGDQAQEARFSHHPLLLPGASLGASGRIGCSGRQSPQLGRYQLQWFQRHRTESAGLNSHAGRLRSLARERFATDGRALAG